MSREDPDTVNWPPGSGSVIKDSRFGSEKNSQGSTTLQTLTWLSPCEEQYYSTKLRLFSGTNFLSAYPCIYVRCVLCSLSYTVCRDFVVVGKRLARERGAVQDHGLKPCLVFAPVCKFSSRQQKKICNKRERCEAAQQLLMCG